MKLLPSRRMFCAHHTTGHQFTVSLYAKPHCRMYICLTVTCRLHFWQSDRDLLHAVAQGWNGYQNKSQHRKLTWRRKFSRRSCRDSNPRPFNHRSGTLTTDIAAASTTGTVRPATSTNPDIITSPALFTISCVTLCATSAKPRVTPAM